MSRALLKSTAVVSGMTLISRLLGFARDMVFAAMFGAAAGTDAFFVAFKIPNFLRRLFAEGAFSQAFVPVLSEYRAREGAAAVRELVGAVAGALGLVLLGLTVLVVLASPAVTALFAPGFIHEAAKFELASQMLKITFPYLFFIALTALASGVLNTYGRFAVPAFTPVWLNVTLISAALWGSHLMQPPVFALAWGVFAAGVVQLLFQVPSLLRLGVLVLPRPNWRHPGVRRILRLMLPALFGSSVAQINLLLDTVIASFLVTGSVSWLYYSDRLMEFPLGVFGIALATVILPSLSTKHAEADLDAFAGTLDWALRLVMLIALPAALGLSLLSGPLLATLFGHGAFTADDIHMSALSLTAFGAGLPGFMLIKVLAPGFYARQDTKTPVRIGIIAMVANMGFNVAFVVPMAMAGIPGPHAGLALATSSAAFLNAGLLWRQLRVSGVYRPSPGWGRFLLQLLFACGALSALLLTMAGDITDWLALTPLQRGMRVGLIIAAGAAIYFAALFATGVRTRQFAGLAVKTKGTN